ncbi:MAG: CHAD domain-containing protein, partial [Alphaproteobacteria bacterium]
RIAAYARAQSAVNSRRFANLVLKIALWVEDGAWRGTGDTIQRSLQSNPIGPFASEVVARMTRHIKKRGEHLRELDVEHRHRLRIRAKRLRYATDFFAHAFGDGGTKRRREFSEGLKAMQTALGRLNDMALARDAALDVISGGSSKALVFVAGELVGRVRSREPQALGKAVKAYRDFAQAKRFWPKPRGADPELPG